MRKIICSLLMLMTFNYVDAQELNCTVNVISPRIQGSDKKIFTTLQQSIIEFMNSTKWTNDKYRTEEKIDCNIQIEVTERTSTDEFKGTLQITSRRPVYKADYNSPILNVKDNDFNFRYIEFQTLEFNESGANQNLVAMLAYYAYLVLGMDYDSFSSLGGTPYFQKMQTIVANMQNAPESGWRSFEPNQRNRYWISENINNPVYRPIRTMFYAYHRNGLDVLQDKKDEGLRAIAASVEGLKKVHAEKPISPFMQLVFDAKADEVVNMFSGAPNEIKAIAKETLDEINPSNSGKYLKITEGNN
ncbi:MAG: DUF4835 family protein [Bacteroidota bacterium]